MRVLGGGRGVKRKLLPLSTNGLPRRSLRATIFCGLSWEVNSSVVKTKKFRRECVALYVCNTETWSGRLMQKSWPSAPNQLTARKHGYRTLDDAIRHPTWLLQLFFTNWKTPYARHPRYVDQSSTPFSSFMTNPKNTGMASYDTQGLSTNQKVPLGCFWSITSVRGWRHTTPRVFLPIKYFI